MKVYTQMLLNTGVADLFSLAAIEPGAVIIEKLLRSNQFVEAESIWVKAN